MEAETIEQGWVVLREDGGISMTTFSYTRQSSIERWVNLWAFPDNWKAHYRKGCRCVRAEMKITLTP